ncbi:hypothetical protein V8F06_011127 [Rhypophila decipiens]
MVASTLPFRALASHKPGAASEDSLCLSQRTWRAPIVACRFLHRARDPLPLLAVLLSVLSTILIPLSTETIRLDYTSINCHVFRKKVYGFGLRTSGPPVIVAETLLVAMAVLVIWMGIILARGRRTGLASEPWNIASMAAFLAHPEFRDVMRSALLSSDRNGLNEGRIKQTLQGKKFRLAYHHNATAREHHDQPPIYIIEVLPAVEDTSPVNPTTRDPSLRKPIPPTPAVNAKRMFWQPRSADLEIHIRAIALVFLIGLLILILYYESTILDTPFERFMDSQSFGIRLLFTSFGTAVSGFWDWYFFQISCSHIHNSLSKSSILPSPPQNIFTGLYTFFRSRDIFALNVAFTVLHAKFIPILFSNIPFRNTVTWKMHEACTWLAVAVLGYMVLVLLATFLCHSSSTNLFTIFSGRWQSNEAPSKPLAMQVKTATILGCMFYLVESEMIKDFRGLAGLKGRERDRIIGQMGRLYTLRMGMYSELENGHLVSGKGDGLDKGKLGGASVVDYYKREAETGTSDDGMNRYMA